MNQHNFNRMGLPLVLFNKGFKKLAVQWLNQVQFFNQTFVQVDSFVLRNRQLLKPAKRCVQFPLFPRRKSISIANGRPSGRLPLECNF